MNTTPLLVSIVMPAHNVQAYIAQSITSVLQQTHTQWELWVVDHNSTDKTASIALSFNDPRINVISHSAATVSGVRNAGLQRATGEFLCFLDSDDLLPENSLKDRVDFMVNNPHISFVDGQVIRKNQDLSKTESIWFPSFKGMPLYEMTKLNARCFCGVTWMIRRLENSPISFDESVHYLDDRWMCLSIAKQGLYDYIDAPIYIVRRRHGSMMHNLDKLEEGYRQFMHRLDMFPGQKEIDSHERYVFFHRMFFRTYLKAFRPLKALGHGVSWLQRVIRS